MSPPTANSTNASTNTAQTKILDDDATLTLTRDALTDIILGQTSFDESIANGTIALDGDTAAMRDLLSLFDTFEFWFNIVTP